MGFFSDLVDSFTGSGARDANNEAGAAMLEQNALASDEISRGFAAAKDLLGPYANLGQTGLDMSNILYDPQAQYDFLQSNPLFQMSLDNANQATSKMAAAKGRLSAGDTLMQLSNNTLLSAQPLLSQQQNNIKGMINTGYGASSNQANMETGMAQLLAQLMVDRGDIEAGRILGEWDAKSNGLAGSIGSSLSGMLQSAITGAVGNIGGSGGFTGGFKAPFGG